MAQTLSPRQEQILLAVVEHYIRRAVPVGSACIREVEGLPWSGATIRHELSELERLGYLDQPHTSAGRVPTDSAYRVFANRTLASAPSPKDASAFSHENPTPGQDLDVFIRQVTRALSTQSHVLGLVALPALHGVPLTELRFLPLASGRAMAVMMTRGGLVRTRFLTTGREIGQRDFERINEQIRRYAGLSLEGIRGRLSRDISRRTRSLERLFSAVLAWMTQLQEDRGKELIIDGGLNLLEQPEFSRIERIRAFLQTIEEKRLILDLVTRCLQDSSPSVLIGAELSEESMADCGIVAVPYGSGDTSGVVGLIGPKRMDYSGGLTLAAATAAFLTTTLLTEATHG
jgi:heat-inducible transcriptional repressor